MGLEIRTYRTLDELETIRAAWDELLASYPLATTFSTPEWLIPWWRSFGGDQELLALGFYDDGRLVGLALLSVDWIRAAKALPLRRLRLMGDGSQDSDNLDFPVRAGYEDKFAESLVKFLTEKRNWDFAEFHTMPPDSPGGVALRRLLRLNKWAAAEQLSPAAAIALPATWEEYLGRLSSEDQKNLPRYTRRIEKRYAVHIFRCEDKAHLEKCLEALFALHQARWEAAGERGSFGSSQRRAFYYETARALLARDRLELWALALDGRIAAAQFGFRHGHTVFQLQEGNDPQHASDRVGFLLRGHVMRALIARGVQCYDFLGGKLEYKARWGAQAGQYLNLRFARPLTFGAAYITGMKRAGAGREWLRQNLPAPAWQTLRQINAGLGRTGHKPNPAVRTDGEEGHRDSN